MGEPSVCHSSDDTSDTTLDSATDTNSDSSSDSDEQMSYIFLSEVLCRDYFYPKQPMYNPRFQGQDWMGEILYGHPERFVHSLHMNVKTFNTLCDLLAEKQYLMLGQTLKVGIQESVAMFLGMIGFSFRQCTLCECFQHSLETIWRHVKRVTKALNKLAPDLICPPNFADVHPRILNDPHLYPYFKDCVGAMDGTLVPAWAPLIQQDAFRSRKAEVSQNVLAICDFNLMFTYVLAGWEGSVNDFRVLMDALTSDPKFPWPPPGKYYLVDSGYYNFPGFLAPYRQQRYHINAWCRSNHQPRGPHELFNKRHSQLCNAIECTFGILKGRFAILKGKMPCYMFKRQVQIVIACCVVHNFICKYCDDDRFFIRGEVGRYDPEPSEDENEHVLAASQQDIDAQSIFRNALATAMWANR